MDNVNLNSRILAEGVHLFDLKDLDKLYKKGRTLAKTTKGFYDLRSFVVLVKPEGLDFVE